MDHNVIDVLIHSVVGSIKISSVFEFFLIENTTVEKYFFTNDMKLNLRLNKAGVTVLYSNP